MRQAAALRNHGMGPRNLFWGVLMLFLACVVLVLAIVMVGVKAMIYLAACLLTFTALFVLARMHVFNQRNGGFLALAVVCLIGTAVPLLEKTVTWVQNFDFSRPVATAPTVTLHSDETAAPLLTQAFALSAPKGNGKQVRVLRDSRVDIDGKAFLIKIGDRFPLVAAEGDRTTFAVRDLQLSLPTTDVEVLDPTALARGVGSTKSASGRKGAAPSSTLSDAELAEITRNAQQEAMRRYPALAMKDSLENAMFISTYKAFRDAGNEEFFSNPEWPIELAQMLADREGWKRGGAPVTTGAPILDRFPSEDASEDTVVGTPVARPVPRAQPVPRAPVTTPPVNMLDAGDGLPRATRPAR